MMWLGTTDRMRSNQNARDLREDLALVGNARAQDVVERRNAIGGDDQQAVAEIVDVSDLALSIGTPAVERGFEDRSGERQRELLSRRRKLRILQGSGPREQQQDVAAACVGRRLSVIVRSVPAMRAHIRTAVVLALAAAPGRAVPAQRRFQARGASRSRTHTSAGWRCRSRRCSSTWRSASLRWQYLLEPLGHASFANAFRATAVGFAASSVLPARAGEVIRPYFLARHENMSATGAFATIILERVLDMLTVLVLLASFIFVFDPGVGRGEPGRLRRREVGGRHRGRRARWRRSSCCSCSPAIRNGWAAR